MAVFFDDGLFDPFYVSVGPEYKNPAKWKPGMICWAPVGFTEEQTRYWRPVDYDDLTMTGATTFRIIEGAKDLFNRPIPLHFPPLATNEEMLVVRGKRRPCVIIALPKADLSSSRFRYHVLVAPCFSATKKESDSPKVSPELLARIRSLEFPDVMFLPAAYPALPKDGFVRLNLMHPVPKGHLEPLNLMFAPDVLSVFQGQIEHYISGRYEGAYSAARELLISENKIKP